VEENMKIVILDGNTIVQDDLNWDTLLPLGKLTAYDDTPLDKVLERMAGAYAVITNKVILSREILLQCPDLKYISVTATGYDNVDVEAAKELGIAVTNIPAYSTDAVAQHTFALILQITNQISFYGRFVSEGGWAASDQFCYWTVPIILLSGKSLGIIGYGNIGKKVAEIAAAFGMTVNVYSQDPDKAIKSDFLTIHCPVTDENKGFINQAFIDKMKDGAVLINTARGSLINEADLAVALKSGKLAAAGLDVLSTEPPAADNPLPPLSNCYITPHVAWIPRETRATVVDTVAENLKCFLEGNIHNRVDLK